MLKNHIKIAIMQNKIDFRNLQRTALVLEATLKQVRQKHPHLICLPEIFLGGALKPENRKIVAEFYEHFVKKLQILAKKNKFFFFGSILERSGKKFFNTAVLISNTGKISAIYHKHNLFRLLDEHKIYSQGKKPRLWNSPWGKIAPLICYDIRFPEFLRNLTLKGARFALVCAQWPSSRRDHWLTLLKARAIENQMFVIACNARGKKGKLSFVGDSCVISPWGKVLFQMKKDQEIGYFKIDLSLVENIRKKYPFLKDVSTPS